MGLYHADQVVERGFFDHRADGVPCATSPMRFFSSRVASAGFVDSLDSLWRLPWTEYEIHHVATFLLAPVRLSR